MKSKITTIILLLLSIYAVKAQKIYDNPNPLWEPEKDEVFLQEVSDEIVTDKPITSLAVFDGICYAVKENKIFSINNNELSEISSQKYYAFAARQGNLFKRFARITGFLLLIIFIVDSAFFFLQGFETEDWSRLLIISVELVLGVILVLYGRKIPNDLEDEK